MSQTLTTRCLLAAALLIGLGGFDDGPVTYKLPPQAIQDAIDAPPWPVVYPSPTRAHMLVVENELYPPIAVMAEPVRRLAGLRVNPATGARRRTTGIKTIAIQPLDGTPARAVTLPPGGSFRNPAWSDDGMRFALLREQPAALELWLGDVRDGQLRQVPGVRLSDVAGAALHWLPGGQQLVARTIEAARGPAPIAPRTPAGPTVEETVGRKVEARTFQDLLRTAHDAALFEHYARAQFVVIDVATNTVTPLGQTGLYSGIDPSPNGQFWLVSRIERPFPFSVPMTSFARSIEVWDAKGNFVATVAKLPVADDVPRQGVTLGPRNIQWQPMAPASLLWVEALDGGDPTRAAEHRDRIMALEAPFTGAARPLLSLKQRYAGINWLVTPGTALIAEYDRDRRWSTTRLVDLGNPATAKIIFDRSVNDAYGDPGTPVMDPRRPGDRVLLQEGDAIFLAGDGASPKGDRPFLDKLDLATLTKTRLHQSEPNGYERFVAFRGPAAAPEILIRREAQTEPPNYHVVDLATGKRRPMTDRKDPVPALRQIRRELVTYRRADGTPLSGQLFLPPGYQPGTRLPALIWAYPLEFSDGDTAGQVRGSTTRFWQPWGTTPTFLALQGYAVLMDATMPIVGNPETVNDTFVEQITSSARAAIDKLDELGVVDRQRVLVGGHSYGAFMTANLLAHTDLFVAGIARSGAYNRTLTPFGFQGERRSYWEATDVYNKVSPFTYAPQIKAPLLLMHGAADSNPGTFPMQSERLFQAIRGTGGTARLVMLPYEDHGYAARESVLHVMAEMVEWADRWTKPAGPGQKKD